jgi:hypothetical protein
MRRPNPRLLPGFGALRILPPCRPAAVALFQSA